jgi:hypothetical protein
MRCLSKAEVSQIFPALQAAAENPANVATVLKVSHKTRAGFSIDCRDRLSERKAE